MAHVSFAELATCSLHVYEAVRAGNYVDAWEHTLTIQEFAIESLKGGGFKSTAGAGATDASATQGQDAESQKEVLDNLKGAKKELGKAKPPAKGKAKSAGAVGKLGDGKLLKKLLEILLAVLPVLFKEGSEEE